MPLIRSLLTNKEGSFHKLKSLDQNYKVVLLTKRNPKRRPASFRPTLQFYLLGSFVKAFLNLSQPTRQGEILLDKETQNWCGFYKPSTQYIFWQIFIQLGVLNWFKFILHKKQGYSKMGRVYKTILGYFKLSTLYTNLILFFNFSGVFLKLTSSSFVRVKFLWNLYLYHSLNPIEITLKIRYQVTLNTTNFRALLSPY